MNKLYVFIIWFVIFFGLAFFFLGGDQTSELIAVIAVATAYISGFFFWNTDQRNFAIKCLIAGATAFLFLILFKEVMEVDFYDGRILKY